MIINLIIFLKQWTKFHFVGRPINTLIYIFEGVRMTNIFYYFTIFSVFANFHVKALPTKDKAVSSDEQIVNSLADQMQEALDSGEYSDIQFLVGKDDKKEIVKAHRVILSAASNVFKAMFRYDKGQIEVPDIEIDAFKLMLKFIYTKHFNGLNANNLFDILKAADKYNIIGLVKECADFPIEKLPNVFVAYEKANQLLSMKLRSSELKIWKAALRWADEQCRQNDIECSAENRRKMLGLALFKIRFPLIPKKEFTKTVVSTGVLTKEEVISIYQHYSHPNLSDLPGLIKLKFPTHRRYKKGETIEMEIEKVSDFALEEVGSERFSDAMEIGGFSWKIMTQIKTKNESNEKWLGFFLHYAEKENWSFKSSATFRIVSQNNGTEDLIGTLYDHVFNEQRNSFGFDNFISFAELLDPSKGFYNKEEDKVKLAIDVIVDEPKTEKIISDPNKSNGTLSMEIEELSEFAREIILSERKSEAVYYIKGMPWKIWAKILMKNESTEKWFGFYLLCDASEKDGNWSRKCSATLRIVSQKSRVVDFKREINRKMVFNNKTRNWGFENFISFTELMDLRNGLYNKKRTKSPWPLILHVNSVNILRRIENRKE